MYDNFAIFANILQFGNFSCTHIFSMLNVIKPYLVWWMGVDYELFFATLCTHSDLLVKHSLGYILMI